MKIKVEQDRNIFGKRQKSFTAAIWPTMPESEIGYFSHIVSASGSSKERAAEALEEKLVRRERFQGTRRYMRGKTTTWCLSYCDGWQYDIVRDENTLVPSSCLLSCKSYIEALEQMQKHFAQHEDCQEVKAA